MISNTATENKKSIIAENGKTGLQLRLIKRIAADNYKQYCN
jgi:hypothetical protein